MAVIYRDDLENVNNYANSILNTEIDDSQKLIDKINQFINNSTGVLQGIAWDNERKQMQSFIMALENRKKIAASLLQSIQSANNIMIDYLNSFPKNLTAGINIDLDKVDTGYLDQLQVELSRASANYNAASNDSNDLAKYGQLMNNCEQLINYISELPNKDAIAYGKYDSVASELISFNSSINNV